MADVADLELAQGLLDMRAAFSDESVPLHERQRSIGKSLSDLMGPVIKAILTARRDAGLMTDVPGADGHQHRLLDAWNRIARRQEADRDWDELTHGLANWMTFDVTYAPKDGHRPTAESVLAELAKRNGRIAALDFGHSRSDDVGASGSMIDWQIEAHRTIWGEGPFERRHVPLEAAVPIGDQAFRITFPSGRMLAADWFRIPEFTELAKRDEPKTCLSTDAGIVESTLHHLRLGIVSIHVRNTSPSVYLCDGSLAIGRERAYEEYVPGSSDDGPDETETPGKVASICTDLWNATLIDRETLTALLEAPCGGREAAEAKVAAYLAKNSDGTKAFQIAPGDYDVHFGPRTHAFAKTFRHPRLPILETVSAYAAIIPADA